METVISIGDFLVSVPGQASALVVRTLSAAFFICSGVQMFDFKRKASGSNDSYISRFTNWTLDKISR